MNRERYRALRRAYKKWVRGGSVRGYHDDSEVTSAAWRQRGERGPYIELGTPLDGLTPREARAVMAHAPMKHEVLGPVRYLPHEWTRKKQQMYWNAQSNLKNREQDHRRIAERITALVDQQAQVDTAAALAAMAPISSLFDQCFGKAAA